MRMSSISKKEPHFIFVADWYIECEIQMYLRYKRMHDYDQYQYCQCGKQITIQKRIRTLWRLFTILLCGHN